ncbi:hypothetical protein HGRIS_008501 [Hohenbuehelia grisea]|uniref:Uncharacterized protein n=1 Tax=Hohenbuehelia grisea TaxID=104357 RepID=A0ABR3J8N2_9AGAR
MSADQTPAAQDAERKGSRNSEMAAKLKDEGNSLHTKKNFRAAYKKYSEAIKYDPENAVLYANRAASSLGMKEYLDAVHDAQEAIKIDPAYAKAYARLATASRATGRLDVSKKAFEDALKTLPDEDKLTDTQKVLKMQFEEGILSVEKELEASLARTREHVVQLGAEGSLTDMPWQRALAMEAELTQAQNSKSSAWVIMNAYRDFQLARSTMDKFQEIDEGEGRVRFTMQSGALNHIVSAVMRDPRVFHISGQFIDKYNKQVGAELQATRGWISGGVNLVQREALARLRTSGWGSIRPALATTIRMWFMKGFFASMAGNLRDATEFYRQALEVLEWGCKEWRDVSREDKGAIFDRSFVRGVRKLYLTAVIGDSKREGSEYTLEDVPRIALDLIKDNMADDPRVTAKKLALDHGSLMSFWFYDKAEALTSIGWYHMQRAFMTEDVDDQLKDFIESANNYIEAAETYPSDDEYHPYFLAIALEAYWHSSAPLRVTLPICERIRTALPDVNRIWEKSQMASERNIRVQQALDFEVNARKSLREGTATMDDMLKPDIVLDPKRVPVKST